MEDAITLLASSALDIAPKFERTRILNEALEYIQDGRGDVLAHWKVPTYLSLHARKRLIKLYLSAWREVTDTDVQRLLLIRLCTLFSNYQYNSISSSFQMPKEALSQLWELGKSEGNIVAISLGISWTMNRSEWLECFVQNAYGSKISKPSELESCKYLLATLSSDEWNDIIIPNLVKKLKSNPEKVLESCDVVLSNLNPNVVTRDCSEFISTLLKQLKSTKEVTREAASRSLYQLAQRQAFITVAAAIAGTLASLAQNEARQLAYTTTKDIGKNLLSSSEGTTEPLDELDNILLLLSTALTKELKAAVTVKQSGCQALVTWMAIAKRNRCTSKSYPNSLKYFTSPLESSNGADMVQRMSAVYMTVSPDIQESLILDILDSKNAKLEQGLQSLVDNAVKKGSPVASVEGLVVLNMVLVNALASKKNLKESFYKVLTMSNSFLYSLSILDILGSNPLVRILLPRTITLFAKYTALQNKPELGAGAVNAIAYCIANPTDSKSIKADVESILIYNTKAHSVLGDALFRYINVNCLDYEHRCSNQNSSREMRETFVPENAAPLLSGKGRGSLTSSHRNFDTSAIHRVALLLLQSTENPSILAKLLILMHIVTTKSTRVQDRTQRKSLVKYTLKVMQEKNMLSDEDNRQAFADEIGRYGSNIESSGDSEKISDAIHEASLNLIVTLGIIGSSFDPSVDDPESEDMKPHSIARALCTENIATRLKMNLKSCLEVMSLVSKDDIALYKTPLGTFFSDGKSDDLMSNDSKMSSSGKKRAGTKGTKGMEGYSFEDEEWERQIKKELAAKKNDNVASSTSDATLSPAQKKQVQEQDSCRNRIANIIDGNYKRVLNCIMALSLSDIEIGNACLPMFGEDILQAALMVCPATQDLPKVRNLAVQSLTTLASCVYEIEEELAPMVSEALLCTCRIRTKKNEEGSTLQKFPFSVTAFPSTCLSAGKIVSEMDDYGDALSGISFAFLFPILRAALTGPRTPTECDGVLRVLHRHTSMLVGEETDVILKSLRKEMAESVLELLSHDRSLTFTNPSPYEVLVSCYAMDEDSTTSPFTTAELSPLIGEIGALGKKNCRVGSMMALASIASKYPKFVKSNPLVENRIWMNCFSNADEIRIAAMAAWQACTQTSGSELLAPSVMYAVSLLPLFSHTDPCIAEAAAKANAAAMGHHPVTMERNFIKFCTSYIDAYVNDDVKKPSAPSSILVALPSKNTSIPKKKPIPVALPKKKVAPKQDALSIMGKPKLGGKAKAANKSRAIDSALLKPKEERTFDREVLENQFKGMSLKEESVIETDTVEKIAIRSGVIRAISCINDTSAKASVGIDTLRLLASFLMAYGLADINEEVRSAARNALRDLVAVHGGSEDAIAFLLPVFEGVLGSGNVSQEGLGSLPVEKIIRSSVASDRRKEGAVVALGSVALHLKGKESEEKIDSTIDMLIAALSTPNESVQSSVADCLAKLMKKGRTQDRLEVLLKTMLKDCLNADTMSKRRGAAYGISALVKGSGIACLKKFDVIGMLEGAADSGSQINKEGSLFAIELLSSRLGLLFEPYVIALLPSLLKSFSDSSDHVRSAAAKTADLIMSKLSAHGVKLVMPAVLTAFDDPAWRTKQASIQMLGSMSHLAPKQLASALPKVVPKLTEAFSDTHPKVKASAQEALEEITRVVKNPEISSISSVLLTALTDPSEGTIRALESLIETEFLHAIDAPSLALIVPILHRGLRDRIATTKRYGALIAGNMCSMINDPKDFLPYLPTLIPDLQSAMLDPIPDVRSTSAKAIGSLTRGLGEDNLPGLRSWLVEKLRDQAVTSAERSGAAQGLTELLVAGGAEVVEDVMREEILPLRSHPSPSTREGVLWILTFLPASLGQSFTPLIDVSFPALISGLSDESEPVRDVAMRAGRVLIRSHGKDHVDKILPSLEKGLTDEDHRIRVASLSLLGDLLSMIGGTSVIKGDGDTQDDIRKAEKAQAQIALALGSDTRKRILSGLYLARSDTTSAVRQIAVQVWKTVVSVTARSLREILPMLVNQVVDALASGHPDRTQVAGRCLGDIVHKLGDSVLPEIIPVLRNALYGGDQHTRQGVCVGLSEVISCSTKEQIIKFIEIIVKVVQDALCDEDESVRRVASSCFKSLHNVVGNRALDEIVPSLLVDLDHGYANSHGRALNGLIGILSIRSKELLPYIIPRLIKSPISSNHALALSGIAEVTGASLYMHFHSIIPSIILELSTSQEEERIDSIRSCARSICRHSDSVGLNWLISEVASKVSSDKADVRKQSCWMLQVFVEERKEKSDFYDQIPIMLRELLYRLNDDNADVIKGTFEAFTALSTHVAAEELVKHIDFIRNLINSMVSDARRRKGGVGDGEFLMPGFNIPRGLEPLLPIYQRGILYGSPTVREASAAGLGELISLTSSKYLAGQLIIKITGPLLRVVGDRNPPEVKIAILRTLGLVLLKGGPALRAFVPQFQTTFVKALSDPSRQVRIDAIKALALLMPLSTRVDPLIKELVSGSLGKAGEESKIPAVQTATLEALCAVLKEAGSKAKLPESIPSALEASKELLGHEDEGVREASAKVMGASCALLGCEISVEVVNSVILSQDQGSSEIRHGQACAARRILSSAGSHVPEDLLSVIMQRLVSFLRDDKLLVKEAACSAIGAGIGAAPNPERCLRKYESHLLLLMNDSKERMEIHKAVANGLCIALQLSKSTRKVSFFGKSMMDACLQLAMSGSQRVQFAFNDVLWIALDVADGEAGLEDYLAIASFDNSKAMKALHSKVLSRMKDVEVDI